MIICYVGPAWGHAGTHGGPKMAQNSTKMAFDDPKWLFMTQNGPAMMSLHDPKSPFMTQNVPA